MASASSTSARSLFEESKNRLADRVQVNMNNVASVVRQVQRGSKSSETIMQTAKQFASQEKAIEIVEANLNKIHVSITNMECYLQSIEKNLQVIVSLDEKHKKK